MKTADPIAVRFARPLALADLLGVDLHVSLFRKLGRWWPPRGPSFIVRPGRVDAMAVCQPRQLVAAVAIAAGRSIYPPGPIIVTRSRTGGGGDRLAGAGRSAADVSDLEVSPRRQRRRRTR